MSSSDSVNIDEIISQLREWLGTQPHLPQHIEGQVLLKFYYACDRDVDRAKVLIDGNYTMRNVYPEIFIERDPCNEATEKVLQNTDFITLPGITPEGHKLFLYRLRSSDIDKFDYTEIVRAFFMFADVRITMPDPIGLQGKEVAIFDMAGYTLKHVFRTTLSTVKIYSKFTQEVHAVRIQQLHVINCPPFVDTFMKFVRPFIRNDVFKVNTILPEAVQFWEQALLVRETKGVIRLNRKCDSTQVFVKNSQTHCIDTCRSVTMCGEVQVPEEHLDVCRVCNATGQDCRHDESTTPGTGIENADFVFYVSARQTERCHKGLTVAYAAHCQQEAALDRPIAGHANLCPDSISTKPQELQTLLSTVKHEILHALGFSVSLYAFFRDEYGMPRTPRKPDTGKPYLNEKLQIHQWSSNTIRKVVRNKWAVRGGYTKKTMDMMVTPRVVEEVRNHFSCPELEGAELEDQGGDGTALTHWEKRILENEAMTGTHTQSPVFSRITLALMEDSGWYKANFSMASPLSWGRGMGCNFVMRSCKDWIQSSNSRGRSSHPFCSKVKRDPLQTECTDDRNSVALCNLVRHDYILPKEFQNFDSINHVPAGEEGYYGGSVSLADHCPYIQEFTWRSRNVIVRGSHCKFEENNPSPEKNFALESYGTNSKCFEHSESMWEERSCKQTREWQHWGSGCYRYECTDRRLSIIVGNYTYECFHPGQQLSIRIQSGGWLHKGAIICPPCQEVCGDVLSRSNQTCRIREESPPANMYPRDSLPCASCTLTAKNFLWILVLATAVVCRSR